MHGGLPCPRRWCSPTKAKSRLFERTPQAGQWHLFVRAPVAPCVCTQGNEPDSKQFVQVHGEGDKFPPTQGRPCIVFAHLKKVFWLGGLACTCSLLRVMLSSCNHSCHQFDSTPVSNCQCGRIYQVQVLRTLQAECGSISKLAILTRVRGCRFFALMAR